MGQGARVSEFFVYYELMEEGGGGGGGGAKVREDWIQ